MKDNNGHVGDNDRMDNDSGVGGRDPNDCPVTERHKEVLSCAAQGMSAKETASYLKLSHRTIEAHLLGARIALFARNTTNAVAIAMRRGIIAGLSVVILANAMLGSVSTLRPRTGGGSAKVARSMSVRTLRRRDKGGQSA
jgi:DNA-binding CsgD family transcriptional regulator